MIKLCEMEEIDECKLSDNSKKGFEFPKTHRICITIFAALFAILILSIYVYLLVCNPNYLDPEKFGLANLLIFALTLLLLVNLPWNKFGMRIKKIGIIELEEKVEGQAKNVSKDIADLQVKIDQVGQKMSDNGIFIEEKVLEKLLLNFLRQYKTWAFSPLRIKDWGSNKEGFNDLNNYSLEEIKTELRRLLAKDIVSTRISKKGNTLYIYNK